MILPGKLFETERLSVRAAAEDDVDLVYALWTDPRVMKHVGFPHGLRITRDEVREQLSKSARSERDRLLVVELKATGRPIGHLHLAFPNAEGIAEPDIKLLPEFWGHGYGVEAWCALVEYEFGHTGCDVVAGTPNVDNTASIKMQEATGAVRVGEGVFEFPESMRDYTVTVHHYTYHVRRADWEPRRPQGPGAASCAPGLPVV